MKSIELPRPWATIGATTDLAAWTPDCATFGYLQLTGAPSASGAGHAVGLHAIVAGAITSQQRADFRLAAQMARAAA